MPRTHEYFGVVGVLLYCARTLARLSGRVRFGASFRQGNKHRKNKLKTPVTGTSLPCLLSKRTYTLFERSEFLIATSPKKSLCVCARLILVLEGSLKRYCCARLILVLEGSIRRYCCRTLRQYDTRYVRTI